MLPLGPADVQLWATTTGGGHRRVAEAVKRALEDNGPPGIRVAIDDPLLSGALPHARLLLLSYGPLVRSSPGIWGFLFRTFARPAARRALERFLISGLSGSMTSLTAARRPKVVVNCHPLLGPSAFRAAQRLVPPARMLTLITDLTVVHPGWLSPAEAHFLSPSAVASSWCSSQGIPSDQIVETGLPVDPVLSAAAPDQATREALRRDLGLNSDLLCLVVGGGGEGAGRMRQLVHSLATSYLPIQLVVLCGRNRQLLTWLGRQEFQRPVTALPYTPDPSAWLLAADCYVGKAGPSALSEAAAAGLGILVTDALPGQESANRQLLVDAGAALSVANTAELLTVVQRMCDKEDQLLSSMQEAARAWSSPEAAGRAAAEILSWL